MISPLPPHMPAIMPPLPRHRQLPLLRMAEEEEEVPAPLRTGGAAVLAAVYEPPGGEGATATALTPWLMCGPIYIRSDFG